MQKLFLLTILVVDNLGEFSLFVSTSGWRGANGIEVCNALSLRDFADDVIGCTNFSML